MNNCIEIVGDIMKKKHEIVKDDLLNKILSETYEVGTLIPKEMDLAEQYDVSRPTVRRAIQSLVADGYLDRKQRVGTRVVRKKIDQEFTQTLTSFNTEMLKKGVRPETQVISFLEIASNNEVADALDLGKGENVYKLVRLRYGDDNPVVIVTTYLPSKSLPNLLTYDFGSHSLYNVLEDCGHGVKSISRTLDIALADELISELLNISVGDPLFYFKSIGKTDTKKPIEYSIARYRSDINTFRFEIELD